MANYRCILIVASAVLLFSSRLSLAQTMPLSGLNTPSLNGIAQAASQNQTTKVKALLLAGESPDVTDDSGQSPLGYAARFGNTEMAQLLIRFHAPVDSRDQFGNTPLHWAAQRGSLEIMRLLIAAKAPVNAQNKQGMTPLMMAASQGQVAAVRLLLRHGANPKIEDYTGRDAFGWAEGNPNVLQVLRLAKTG